MEKNEERLRTREEIEIFARKKAIVYSVIFMSITCIFAIFLVYSSFKEDELRLSIVGLFILIYAIFLYIRNRHVIEREENYKNELLYEKIYLSQEEKRPVIPLDKVGVDLLREKGAKFYAKLTENDNIYIYTKTDKGEEEFAYLGKGRFRKHYKML